MKSKRVGWVQHAYKLLPANLKEGYLTGHLGMCDRTTLGVILNILGCEGARKGVYFTSCRYCPVTNFYEIATKRLGFM
jgi:hypothetical protein